jgi:hypothetical protein
MNLKLIGGSFSNIDALNIIGQLLEVKIKFHEGKILTSGNEEDIKNRESKIKALQNDLRNIRLLLKDNEGFVTLNAQIDIS